MRVIKNEIVIDNDLHIHSKLSSCSNDPEQNCERILQYAKENGLNTICLTDHFWDETVDGALDMNFAEGEAETVLRIYKIAKECKCKFYLGSDAHYPKDFSNTKEIFERAVNLLGLSEKDKFIV